MTQRGRSAVSIKDLLDAGLLKEGQQLRFGMVNEAVAALTSDGTISLSGKSYSSPSTAGRAINGGVAVNGWTAWRLADGDGATLAEVRRRFGAPNLGSHSPQ
jgi:hypothetical protein